MLKKQIKYTDYDGVERDEVFYFNLNKAEIVEMEFAAAGSAGFGKFVEKIVEEKNAEQIMKIFKDLILKAYGIKSADGRRFEKSEKLSIEFSQTEAYVELYMELSTDAEAAAAFVNGILPQDMISKN